MNPMPEPQPLAPRYYLDNFERLCTTVFDQYGDLLRERELEFLRLFQAADVDARCLFVRLASRRGPLFRVEELHYPELDDLDGALAENLSSGLLGEVHEPDVADLVSLLRRSELVAIFREELKLSGRERKLELTGALLAAPTRNVLDAWQTWRDSFHRLVEVHFMQEVELLQLLFFGNSYQTLTDFVLSDLGIASYEPYRLDRDYRLFDSRGEIEEYLSLRDLKTTYKQAVAEGDCEALSAVAESLCETSVSPRLSPIRDSLANRVARQLEREAQPEQALALFALSAQHPARQRRARLLASRGLDKAALELCETMQADPWCEAEADFVRRELPKLRRRLSLDHCPVKRDRFEEDHLLLHREAPVEQAAARHYAACWQEVHYVENLLINGTFGLAFWDQIFMPVPGAFVNPYQAAPLDMYTQEFYKNRRGAIDRRLAALEACDLRSELLAAYERHFGTSNRWVAWRGLPVELLDRALGTIPGRHWLACWRRILFDPEANRTGCPDLVALDPTRGFCLIEVKGPGDQLQLNQRRWLRFFRRERIPARVARVQWLDD